MGDGRSIEIQAAFEFITMLVGYAFGIIDHLRHIIGGDGPMCGLPYVQRLNVFPISLGIMARDVPNGLRFLRRHFFHLVFACIRIVGQMPDIGDVDDMGQLIALVGQHAAQRVGKDISAHIADMWVIIHRRSAGIDARFAFMNGCEGFQLPG